MNGTNNQQPQILIAEDNTSNYLLFEFLLKQNYQLLHAINGREAIELFTLHQPQLIIMDIKMPEVDGFEATQAIRELSTTVPIIAVTAYAFHQDQERILNSGFNAYISKPINSTELKKTIEQLLN